jgi:hypothetical protein
MVAPRPRFEGRASCDPETVIAPTIRSRPDTGWWRAATSVQDRVDRGEPRRSSGSPITLSCGSGVGQVVEDSYHRGRIRVRVGLELARLRLALILFGFQADIMNGVDPAPQDVTLQNGLFSGHRVKAFSTTSRSPIR